MWDVVVVGAGAAGLAAAEMLGRAGRTVLLVEARNRIGGRIYTWRDSIFPIPVELGAEFVHGRPAVTLRLLRQGGIGLMQVPETHGLFLEGRVQAIDLVRTLRPLLEQLPPPEAPDSAFAAFLEQALPQEQTATRALARIVAESFEAADPEQLSLQALAEDWRVRANEAADYPQFRPVGGYDRLVETLYRRLNLTRVRVHLQTVVTGVRWEPGRVEVHAQQLGQPRVFQARALILTVPLPLLQGDQTPALHVDPPLPEPWRNALAQLEMGAAVRVNLCFREAFWETHAALRELAFIHAPDERFTTIWQPLPLRVPVLLAWAGGPAARRLADWPEEAVIQEALRTIGRLYGIQDPGRYLVSACLCDWQRDPFAQGAYSYVRPGGIKARRVLRRPVHDTIFLAGEATDPEEPATVAGALQSGYRAARDLLATQAGVPITPPID
ncbi:flavin monoamine oxidase family protein [Rhodothermus profundi]|uniref:Tryptophan 2-monooxygenase n=1 Tax=Rhodothermus profundi TaxID=633813 RepID=A0A1M6URL4_9BACT|nr:NAD(P)/FAD-dependent oxidoreductase [Rhodothermus profundi]SHK71820.1 Monoamine oxidase [Rhodothermus profundi]